MTTVYFIRHAKADNSNRDGRNRPLTEKGINDRALVTKFLQDKKISAVLSSPYKRAVDTIADFSRKNGFTIELVEDFRERKSDGDWLRDADFIPFMKRQWADFSYSLSDGECLAAVQRRNIAALNKALAKYKDKNIVIATHGTALSTIINYYDNTYGFGDFMAMIDIMPWVVKMYFDGNNCAGMEKIDLFNLNQKPDCDKCIVRTAGLGTLKAYRYVVIFARYQDKWLYCRAKKRNTFETAGGRIGQGETALDAAKRELCEEAGAINFDISPAFDFSVHIPIWYFNGQVFIAHINRLERLPDFKIAEVKLFGALPDKMRLPRTLPVLYTKMQEWLNLQSAKDEIWDVYDSRWSLTGRTHRRGDPLPAGDYHLVVHIWLQNSNGELLITKRAPNKGYPNMWECTGGSALAGDNSLSAAIREVKEETGLDAKPENGRCIFTITSEDTICDVWLFRQDFDIRDAVLQENETVGAKYASADEIRRMIDSGEFIAYHYIEDLLKKVKRLL